MKFLIIAAIIALYIFFPPARPFMSHPFKTLFYVPIDLYNYLRYKHYYIPSTGKLSIYCGLFGAGKTLSAVHFMVNKYNRYEGKPIWVKDHWEKIHVRLLSNVELQGVPYEPLESLQQVVDYTKWAPEHPNVFCYVLIDEISVQLNSRNFKNNIDAYFLNSLLCCRHFRLEIIGTSQRFLLVDKLMRDVTSEVYQCAKTWRGLLHFVYSAFELENATDPTVVKPKRIEHHFVTDSWFKSYDTLATVEQLSKSCVDGDMISSQEIMNNVAAAPDPDSLNPKHLHKFFRKARKK